VYLIDFGLAKRYQDPKSGKHSPHVQTGRVIGTPDFLSKNASQGFEQSRKDDLESIANVLLFFLKNRFPWSRFNEGVKHCSHDSGRDFCEECGDQHELDYKEFRKNVTVDEMCKNVPVQLKTFLDYCQNELEFEATPDYAYLTKLLKKLVSE
jgi:serine/threonine protein kinase